MAEIGISIGNLSQDIVDYNDNDIVIIDNIKNVELPESAKASMNIIAICTNGRVQANMNSQPISLNKNQIIICPANTNISDFMLSPDLEVKAILFTNRILQSFLHEKMNVWNDIIYRYKMHTFSLYDFEIEFLQHFYEMLRICFNAGKDNPYFTDVVQSLLRSAFIGLIGMLKQSFKNIKADSKLHTNSIFQQFLELLGSSAVKHRSVASYASELCISTKHLTNICKKKTGKTANEWITEYVIEDIRYYLRDTDMPLKQICDTLGFPNPSFFGKYVKEHFGTTPAQLRGR
ncbi:MAG: AraC family transcriptional regulator [Bacteroidales bacterium]|nr:AraC family transcriptional regulator [Bacteroidales bacterium]